MEPNDGKEYETFGVAAVIEEIEDVDEIKDDDTVIFEPIPISPPTSPLLKLHQPLFATPDAAKPLSKRWADYEVCCGCYRTIKPDPWLSSGSPLCTFYYCSVKCMKTALKGNATSTLYA